MISPLPVGTVVGALDSSPQGVLQLVALLASKAGGGSTSPMHKSRFLHFELVALSNSFTLELTDIYIS